MEATSDVQQQIDKLQSELKHIQEKLVIFRTVMKVINHDLRTPLSVIIGNLQDLADKTTLAECDQQEVQEIAQDALNGSLKLLEMIDEIRDAEK